MPIKSFKQYIKEYTPGNEVSKNVIDKTNKWDKEDVKSFMSQGKSGPRKEPPKKPLDISPKDADKILPGPQAAPGGMVQKKSITPPKPQPKPAAAKEAIMTQDLEKTAAIDAAENKKKAEEKKRKD